MGECDMHLCPVEVAEAAIGGDIGWITNSIYLRPLLPGQVEPTGKQCTGVMGSGVPSPTLGAMYYLSSFQSILLRIWTLLHRRNVRTDQYEVGVGLTLKGQWCYLWAMGNPSAVTQGPWGHRSVLVTNQGACQPLPHSLPTPSSLSKVLHLEMGGSSGMSAEYVSEAANTASSAQWLV